MATGKSGSFDLKVSTYSSGACTVRFYWHEDYDIAGNFSRITLTKIGVQPEYHVRDGVYYVSADVTADGVPVASFYRITVDGDADAWNTTDINQTSAAIYHDAATGAKSVTLTATLTGDLFSNDAGWTAGSGTTVSVTVDLTTIPRMSEVSAPNGVIGSALTISVSRKSTAYTHTLTYAFGSASGTIVSGSTAGAISWTPPLALCSQIPNAASGTCTITCLTYDGSTLIGTSTCTMLLTVPNSVGLTVSDGWAVVALYNEGAVSGFGTYVQGYSKAQVTFDSSKISIANAYGAAIASYSITHNGSTIGSPYRTGVLGTAGAQSIVCTVTDTRGRTVSQTLTITVEAYANPTLSDISIFRCMSNGTAADDGTYLSVTATGNISSVDGENSMTITAAVRTVGGSYGDEAAAESGKTAVLFDGLVSAVQTYEVRLTLTDRLGNTSTFTMVIPTANVFFNGRAGGNGAAFGKYAEEDDLLEVVWNLKTKKNLTVEGTAAVNGLSIGGKALLDYFMPVGYIYTSSNPTSPAELFGGTWEQLKDRVIVGAGGSYAVNTTGGSTAIKIDHKNLPVRTMVLDVAVEDNQWCTGAWSNQHGATVGNSLANYAQISSYGYGEALNVMTPYLAVYMWKRVE